MILVDAVLPDCCAACFAYGCCAIVGQLLPYGAMHKPPRPESCPLIEVEEKRIRERVSHVDWQDRTVYVRKEETHDR